MILCRTLTLAWFSQTWSVQRWSDIKKLRTIGKRQSRDREKLLFKSAIRKIVRWPSKNTDKTNDSDTSGQAYRDILAP